MAFIKSHSGIFSLSCVSGYPSARIQAATFPEGGGRWRIYHVRSRCAFCRAIFSFDFNFCDLLIFSSFSSLLFPFPPSRIERFPTTCFDLDPTGYISIKGTEIHPVAHGNRHGLARGRNVLSSKREAEIGEGSLLSSP